MRTTLLIGALFTCNALATPTVERIIENAPNPIGGANAFSFHHYALNRETFDNTEVSIPGNNFGLSLESAHPLFSENLAGNVISYYENGEKPNGTTSNVWNFLMNATGDPLAYTPSVESDKFCVYFHRRYLLSQIAADAASAVTNLGFVNTPDQWWIQVQEIFDDEGNVGGQVGPDYLIWDHPEAAGDSKFARLAREQRAIQTQSNEKWCFSYDVPVAIKLIKGKKVVNESVAQWPNEWKPWLDPVIKIPSINGYAHFLGANQFPLQPDENNQNIQYLGYEYLAYLLDDNEYANEDIVVDQAAYIKKNTHAALTQFWKNFIKFGFNTNSNDPFSIELRKIMQQDNLTIAEREIMARKAIGKKTRQYLVTEAKNYPVNKFKGNLYSSFGDIDKVKAIFKSIKSNGLKSTLSKVKLNSLKNLAKSAGPEGVLNLGFNIWNIVDNIKNPGNPVESMIIYYVPGVMDGMTLSVDTSTLTNNFHLTSQHSELNEKNTSELPVAAFNAHVEKVIAPFGQGACYYTDEEDPNSKGQCLTLNQLQPIDTNFERLTLPVNHWIKVQANGKVFYLTRSFLSSESSYTLSELMRTPSTLVQLVDKEATLKKHDMCGFSDELFQGIAICTNSEINLNLQQAFGQNIKSILINENSDADIDIHFSDNSTAPLLASIPFFDVFEQRPILVTGENAEPSSVILYADSDYLGRSVSLDQSVPNLGDLSFNDAMMSFQIPEGWTVRFYKDANYEGDYYTRTGSAMFTGYFDNVISSVKIFQPGETIVYDHTLSFYNGGAYTARFRVIDEKTGAEIYASPYYIAGQGGTYQRKLEAGHRIEIQRETFGWITIASFSADQLDDIKHNFIIRSWGTIFNSGAVIE